MGLSASILVLLGLIGLSLSLKPAYQICAYSQFSSKGWLTLLMLIALFIVSYFSYLSLLLKAQETVNFIQLVVAGIFFAGGWFVYLVTRLSKQTIENMDNLLQEKNHQANHDLLTGLPNRQQYYRSIDQFIAKEPETFYCMMLDINNFKMINDTFGHSEGDRVLQIVAERIDSVLPADALAARIGGDEIAIIIPDAQDRNISIIAKQIEQALLVDIPCSGHMIVIGASIGIAQFPKDGQDRKSLMKNADIAMYSAKRNEVSHQYFQPHLTSSQFPKYALDIDKSSF
ncbi:GGDEF domain-containing protein [Shewanella sp. 1_MG-2023]|uniref:GGDEF domain-containing protein n=1 Tax=Shewanella electrodiphila TaxID=934143 RepID=A0ABT0KIT8_9GAMM|nr:MULTISPECIES: GGDEF domain-containing protein [Shewanella]MCC4833679.1 GGDEF domain-containing protein [Shewanella sp. 10N.7]MCL1043761.1 GGDEF domain-containing protein [Shewanella electrodiphila]MDO6613829.1 GGDEF domain-containing protein [Shewanella sp. 7_MG-2023]MDO6773579.1 GGDEF domain-containing protein [Shewanella sp. 2_MG-2023]MDO6796436.1 GGDEF domain-containing protein [Shewanella sp. 1_MG-2023]